jgi:probable rRNA maturation factor
VVTPNSQPELHSQPELDLAFDVDPELEPGLALEAGELADPLAGADRWHQLLRDWLAALAAELPDRLAAPSYCLGLSLVGDAEIADLNGTWRQQDQPTDVLAFAAQDESVDGLPPLLPPLPPPSAHPPAGDGQVGRWADGGGPTAWASWEPLELGDIVISLETAVRQAGDHGNSLERELLFLASHGLLHLLGWDHPDGTSLAAMLARQEELLALGPPSGRGVGDGASPEPPMPGNRPGEAPVS